MHHCPRLLAAATSVRWRSKRRHDESVCLDPLDEEALMYFRLDLPDIHQHSVDLGVNCGGGGDFDTKDTREERRLH